MKIVVDADACPKGVLQACLKKGKQYGIPVLTVASFNHNIRTEHHLVVGNASQETDLKVLNLTEKRDVVVTQDWGLAAMILGKEARCINFEGREYKQNVIDFLLEAREIKAKFRRSGGRTRGPKKRTAETDKKFAATLEKILQEMAAQF
ncbi:MAG TPA: DUF188 domain-containing protein [Firmicutes bacterium]|nr:DUF188 domain-containing protein [Bacillota bacterium]